MKATGYLPAYTHAQHVVDCLSKHVDGVDYVQCRLCDFVSARLAQHVEIEHGLSKGEYIAHFNCALMPSKVRDKYSACNKHNGDWISRRRAAGADLTEYRIKMGVAVSDSIMSNPVERKRRSELCKNILMPIAQSDIGRERSREVAIRTSARPEVQAARTENLRRWRAEHFEDFYEKCLSKMHACWHSKPERLLFELLRGLDGFTFKHNQVVKSDDFENVSKRKQCDIADKAKRLYIEFDGILHFEPRRGQESFIQGQRSDVLFDAHIVKHRWTLIRIGYDQFKYRKHDGGYFLKPCLEALFKLITDPVPGVHYLGSAYGDRNALKSGSEVPQDAV